MCVRVFFFLLPSAEGSCAGRDAGVALLPAAGEAAG